jgi:RHS repeat-associated protein
MQAIIDAKGEAITDGTAAANVNPFRYKSYYYDTDTNFYYLQSRYYNPEWGRFLCADGTVSTDATGILSANMYAYCENDPINACDPTGAIPISGQGRDEYDKEMERMLRWGYAIGGLKYLGWTSDTWLKGDNTWSARYDAAKDGRPSHMHVITKKGAWAQNIDGSPHDDHKNSPGDPPKWILKEIKSQCGWDWIKKSANYREIVKADFMTGVWINYSKNPLPYLFSVWGGALFGAGSNAIVSSSSGYSSYGSCYATGGASYISPGNYESHWYYDAETDSWFF